MGRKAFRIYTKIQDGVSTSTINRVLHTATDKVTLLEIDYNLVVFWNSTTAGTAKIGSLFHIARKANIVEAPTVAQSLDNQVNIEHIRALSFVVSGDSDATGLFSTHQKGVMKKERTLKEGDTLNFAHIGDSSNLVPIMFGDIYCVFLD